jgi:hypothetical protein
MSLLKLRLAAATAGLALMVAGAAHATDELLDSGKLLLTGGVTNIEGASGGGLATWSTITGYETGDGIAPNAHFTFVRTGDYELRDYGASVGLFNRVELSYASEDFDTLQAGATLGLGRDYTFHQDVYGAKVRLFGDLVYDQDSLLPQVAAGVQIKHNENAAIIHAVGAKDADGVDYYVSATKLLLDQNLVLDATVRVTKANQTGILGFGGDRSDAYKPQFEGSAGYLVTKRLLVGAEYRTKPSNLGFAKESDWYDLFAAYAINKHLSVTAAYADLGSIATLPNQHGLYLSLQVGF